MSAGFQIGRLPHTKGQVSDVGTFTFTELAELVSKHYTSETKDGPGWVPGVATVGPRSKTLAQAWPVLALDIEGDCQNIDGDRKQLIGPKAPELQDVADWIEELGWSAVLSTSWWHEGPSEGGGTVGPRYRIVFEISHPVGHEDRAILGRHVAAMIGLEKVYDPCVDDANRFFYMPTAPAERMHLAQGVITNGKPLDVDALLAQCKVEAQVVTQEQTAPPPAREGGSVIAAFNEQADFGTILAPHGYKKIAKRWLSPVSSSGDPGIVIFDNGRMYCHHHDDVLYHAKHTRDAFDVWMMLEHGGDMTAAVRAAARILGISHSRSLQAPAEPFDAVATRRAAQRQENAEIQARVYNVLPRVMQVEEMLEQLVFVQDGSQVCLLENPRLAMALADARNAFAASIVTYDSGRKTAPAINVWLKDPARVTVARRTFMPGDDQFCTGPEGHLSVNTWRGFERKEVANAGIAVRLFLEHLEYLMPDDTERGVFLDWLAHIEQFPGVLPHYGWLHIARHTGTGRNWLASVLARVWRGHVAPNVDLPTLLESQFNGQLSETLIAMVDEVQEGGDSGYRHINRLKSLLNAETRAINPKYGRTVIEKNCCRWLVFSNHENAIPMSDTDRRWRVVVHDQGPREPRAYESLYGALSDPAFIDAVAYFLRTRDISHFKPGERPPMTESKSLVIEASKSSVRRASDQLIEEWGSDVITSGEAARYLENLAGKSNGNAARHALSDAGAKPLRGADGKDRIVRVGGKTYRVWVLRNHSKWWGETPSSLSDEVFRGSKELRF